MKDYRTHLEVQSTATTFDGSMTVELLPRRFIPAGFHWGVEARERPQLRGGAEAVYFGLRACRAADTPHLIKIRDLFPTTTR